MGTTALIVIASPRSRVPRILCLRADGYPGRVIPLVKSIARRHRHTIILDPMTAAGAFENALVAAGALRECPATLSP